MSWWRRIDPYNPKPVYLQIKDAVYISIAKGELTPGEKIPPIRELARLIGVNPGTVARAYKELAEEKIISTRAGGGSYISPHISDKIPEIRKELLMKHIQHLMDLASELGVTENELIDLIKGVLKNA